MTLNGRFALKSVLGSDSNRLACFGFQTKLLGNLLSFHYINMQENFMNQLDERCQYNGLSLTRHCTGSCLASAELQTVLDTCYQTVSVLRA